MGILIISMGITIWLLKWTTISQQTDGRSVMNKERKTS